MTRPKIEITADGSHTLIHPLTGDSYHSVRGAVGESMHVFIGAGLRKIEKDPVRILEVGFGSGLNALLTLKENRPAEYHAVEPYPISIETAQRLNYASEGDLFREAFLKMHTCPWGSLEQITHWFGIKKYASSLLETKFDTTFDLIYFDAFAPETQPELWSAEVFGKLFEHTSSEGLLVTYSAKGSVRRAMAAAGYSVSREAGALGKRHMLVARK